MQLGAVSIYHNNKQCFFLEKDVENIYFAGFPLQRMKIANFYKSRPSELDKSLLTVIPDAPRVPQPGLPSNYDWSMFNDETYRKNSNSNVRVRI